MKSGGSLGARARYEPRGPGDREEVRGAARRAHSCISAALRTEASARLRCVFWLVFVFLLTGNIAVVRRFPRLLTVVEDDQPEQPPGACRPPWSPSPPVQPPVRPPIRCTTSSCCGKSVSFLLPPASWEPELVCEEYRHLHED